MLDAPIAMRTLLGWIVSGPTSDLAPNRSTLSANLKTSNDDLNVLLRKFWEVEEAPTTSRWLTEDERAREDFFQTTVSRNAEGRYVVRLPFKDNKPTSWAGSYSTARRMLQNLERKFQKDSILRTAYMESMHEYLSLNHMRRAPPAGQVTDGRFFLPHHGVVKESSTTTQMRTVFNASAKTKGGYSLNDFLHVGPNLLSDVIDLLTRWRQYLYVFSADVEKMFRQILVHEADQHVQAILWREEESEEIESFLLTTVTFGLACSPFLANRTLKQLARDEAAKYPLGSQSLEKEIYADDVLSGDFTLAGAKAKQEQVISLLRSGRFNLRKWRANDPELIKWLPKDSLSTEASLKVGLGFSVLGIAWNPSEDYFYFNLALKAFDEPVTKRTVLSRIAQLFDPLGWIAPAIVSLKIFMQSLWALTKEWDQPLTCSFEFHGFSDASKLAYAGVVYLRVLSEQSQVYLLGAKTKAAPVKTLSIPRLELCAAQLVTKLTRHFIDTLRLPSVKVHLWSDSKDLLFWLREIPAKWPTFVANRCADIAIVLPEAHWHHINSADNPADLASRGSLAGDLVANELRWKGPKRLRISPTEWSCASDLSTEQTSQRNSSVVETPNQPVATAGACTLIASKIETDGEIWPLINEISAVIKDFPTSGVCNIISSEVRQAKLVWSYLTQRAHFRKEFETLSERRELPKGHHLRSLYPQLRGGLLRVGGRLKHCSLSDDENYPVILPDSSTLTDLVTKYCHHLSLHGGGQLTLALVRRMFWIIKGKLNVKTCIRNCISCKRFNAVKNHQLMGDLPAERVQPARPFLNAGVDYARPYQLRTSHHRGYKSYKGYFAIFICMSTKAAHLEVVSSYDSEGFIAAFRRFVSRRGPCLNLFSDQGNNFVGADAELRRMHSAGSDFHRSTEHSLSRVSTSWYFNPPGAPHFGGIWEAAVKSAKYHLKRVVGETILTYEEFSTLLCQVEACLNSRPLIPLSGDVTESLVLILAHFLIGESSLLITEPRITNEKVSPLQRWRRIQQITQCFWDCWSSEYLQQLQKWTIKVNDIVLVRHETRAPTRWPLARVINFFPGADGLVRVAAVRTSTTTLRRPIVKLVKILDADSSQVEAVHD